MSRLVDYHSQPLYGELKPFFADKQFGVQLSCRQYHNRSRNIFQQAHTPRPSYMTTRRHHLMALGKDTVLVSLVGKQAQVDNNLRRKRHLQLRKIAQQDTPLLRKGRDIYM